MNTTPEWEPVTFIGGKTATSLLHEDYVATVFTHPTGFGWEVVPRGKCRLQPGSRGTERTESEARNRAELAAMEIPR